MHASRVTAQGVTRFHDTPVQTDMELLSVLKRAARGCSTTNQEDSNTVPSGSGSENSPGYLPPTACLEKPLKCCSRPTQIHQMQLDSQNSRQGNDGSSIGPSPHLSARRIVARIGEGHGKRHFPMIACHPQAHNPLGHEEDVRHLALALARRCACRWSYGGTTPGRKKATKSPIGVLMDLTYEHSLRFHTN